MSNPSFRLPNRTYAHLLIKVALRFLGNDYHLMLRKNTLEKLDGLYRGQCFDDPILLCRLFAIFAIGELYTNRKATAKASEVPGTGFFMQAMSLFQDLHEEATVSYIEILILLVSHFLAMERIFFLTFIVSLLPTSESHQVCIYVCRHCSQTKSDIRAPSQCSRRICDISS